MARRQTRRTPEGIGASPASASVVTLDKGGDTATISGTTTINHMTKNRAPGGVVMLTFSGALQLTHNAGSVPTGAAAFKLLGAANYTTVAGDRAQFQFDGTDWVQITPFVGTTGKLGTVSKFFKSTEQTGNGSAQNIAHGLGVTPSLAFVLFTDTAPATAGVATMTEGTHDATNVVVTMTTGKKYKVVAFA